MCIQLKVTFMQGWKHKTLLSIWDAGFFINRPFSATDTHRRTQTPVKYKSNDISRGRRRTQRVFLFFLFSIPGFRLLSFTQLEIESAFFNHWLNRYKIDYFYNYPFYCPLLRVLSPLRLLPQSTGTSPKTFYITLCLKVPKDPANHIPAYARTSPLQIAHRKFRRKISDGSFDQLCFSTPRRLDSVYTALKFLVGHFHSLRPN
jgi:hypothetical protein